eukprot:CAMPEP_0201484032 /NCGR_PEP_ID=MMETSP0151_2-20130828/8215_1 /ASSEMBLY_ACC=CAM_ASM_000257 /TAXON_ID=200890 /ORGANISM="Paramoeba atlantica, Strain 621/1 / CCAP 1560/9" /LENGTH=475 /DNA_ID=CAMNT_0047867479 /DNA_START=84 /DNA_END=1511 /DNA_ORIENTATION=+
MHSSLRSQCTTPVRFASTVTVDNPYDGTPYCEIPIATSEEGQGMMQKSVEAQKIWATSSMSDRIAVCQQFMDSFESHRDQIARDITGQTGRPLHYSQGEVNGTYERARAMMELAPQELAPEIIEDGPAAFRQITKEPVGTVLVLAPWNYPLLTAVNAIVPAILAGNSVVVKHSFRTPLCADHFADSFGETSAPAGLVQSLQANHELVHQMINDERVGFVSFTGSVEGGHQVYKTVANRFIDVTLELGGKDGAYVAADADIEKAAAGLVDGAFFNAGQSCCGIERVYCHKDVYEKFLELALPIVQGYKLGDPMSKETTMGPMAQPNAPGFLQEQVSRAVEKGARLLCGGSPTTDASGKGRFFQPALVADCDHGMDVMTEESFGPILAVAPVDDDDHAVQKINDSCYGLTSAIFTASRERALSLAPRLQVGTVFMNRCDYLDPMLPWTGHKDTGKGVSLSHHGFRGVTKLKGYNFKN